MKRTRRLGTVIQHRNASPVVEAIYVPEAYPWRVMFTVRSMGVRLIVDLASRLTLGRTFPGEEAGAFIDLEPFDADICGVSRRHLIMKLENGHVVVVDNNSLNGTQLNGRQLIPGESYPVQHGDTLMLGNLELQVGLLVNPLR